MANSLALFVDVATEARPPSTTSIGLLATMHTCTPAPCDGQTDSGNGRERASPNGSNLPQHRPQIIEARDVDGEIHHGKLPPKPPYRFIGELPSALAHLRNMCQWVGWDYRPKDGKWTKPPFNPHTGRHASVSDRATWGTFDAALAGMERYGFVGVGVALDADIAIVGIDLDHCITEAGSFSDLAAEIIGYGETYAEVSPSGAGIRLFASGQIAKAVKDDASGVEVYGSGRYLTVTGQHIPETPSRAAEAPRTLARLAAVVAAARETKKQRSNAKGNVLGPAGDVFRRVNDAALTRLDDWVPALFPKAAQQATGAWRITSKHLGRSYEEDLSIHPSGIQDFGPEKTLTPIDLVLEHGGARDAVEAALWLCKQCGLKTLAPSFVQEKKRDTEQKSRGQCSGLEKDKAADLGLWPIMESKAAHGLVGKIAQLATANSEADPVAVIATALTYAAAEFGRAQYIRIGDDIHHSRHFGAIVGQSSRARKGTSYGPVRRIFGLAETIRITASTLPFPSGSKLKISSGPLSSGEGLVYAVRDVCNDGDDDDPGVEDKRLLVVEQELGAALRAFQRAGNNLSMILRMAFDGGTIAPLTKHNRTVATNPHINVVGHITRFELRELLAETEIWNGLGNRFQWLMARRPKRVPFPMPMPDDEVNEIAAELARVITLAHARGEGVGHELVMSNSAQIHWATVYPELTQDYPGILGAVTSRQEAHARRLALTYAQLDGAERIEIAHLEAALAFCRYAFDSAAYLFGAVELDPVAEKILKAISAGPKSQTGIRDLFGRHQPAKRLTQVLTDLQERGRITLTEEQTGGRPRKVWRLAP